MQASKAVLSFSQRDQNSDFKLPENESAMPDSSASNRVQSKEDKSISGEGKKLETRQRSFPDTLDREKTALQLLELHASLADLSGRHAFWELILLCTEEPRFKAPFPV